MNLRFFQKFIVTLICINSNGKIMKSLELMMFKIFIFSMEDYSCDPLFLSLYFMFLLL